MELDFWKDRRVMVTGHTGFKGSWLCLWLDSLGAKVVGYSLEPPTDPSLYELANVQALVDSKIGDVDDLPELTRVVNSFQPEVIFHFAAQSVVLRSYEDPVETYRTNVMGTVHILEAVRQAGIPVALINVTTDKVYENTGLPTPYKEDDRLGGSDPYSNSKSCSELVSSAFRDSFFPVDAINRHGVSVSTARAGNVIGGGDWTPWQLVPDVAQALSQGDKVRLRHPDALRPWQHVLDCLCGYLTLAERQHAYPEDISGEWNFGPIANDVNSVKFVVETFAHRWGVENPWTSDLEQYAHEEPVLQLDSKKAMAKIGWQQCLPIDTAINWVADWYQDYYAGAEARELCLRQIRDYENLLGLRA